MKSKNKPVAWILILSFFAWIVPQLLAEFAWKSPVYN